MFKKINHIHFVGIGGAGMSGIAQVLLSINYKVTGSDISKSDAVLRLVKQGAKVYIGHKKENIYGADVVVTSTAIFPDNPEVEEALRKKIPVIPRAEMLAELMRLKYAITIAGTHGKTTTTSIVAMILDKGGLDPTVIIGGKLMNIGSHARYGKGDYIVAEADESDGSFLKLTPAIAIVTNIDADHLDYYGNIENIKEAFVTFVNKVPFYGCSIICGDDVNTKSIIPMIKRKYYTYGLNGDYDFTARDIKLKKLRSEFTVYYKKTKLGMVEFSKMGRHNVSNALAAIAVGHELGIKFTAIKEALRNFKGVERRLEIIGEKKNVEFIDDYGHHPNEIIATLDAIKKSWPDRRLLVIFQPHRYTRTKAHQWAFAKSFEDADKLWLTPIYPAGEQPISGVSTELIMAHFSKNKIKNVMLIKDMVSLIDSVKKELRPGDILLTLGAGPIWKTGRQLFEEY